MKDTTAVPGYIEEMGDDDTALVAGVLHYLTSRPYRDAYPIVGLEIRQAIEGNGYITAITTQTTGPDSQGRMVFCTQWTDLNWAHPEKAASDYPGSNSLFGNLLIQKIDNVD